MKRRDFITLLGGAAAEPLFPRMVRAQHSTMPVIGYLGSETPELFASRLRAFRQGLSAAGYDEGRNVAIEYRWAEGRNDQLPALAADLVRAKVAVIVTPGSVASALAAKGATFTIPIVFETGTDPIEAGLVVSLNRPAGNLTGVSSLNAQVGPKRLELLHQLAPAATLFTLLINPTNPTNADATSKSLQAAARERNLQLRVLSAGTEFDFGNAFALSAQLRAAGAVIANDIFYATHSEQLAALSLRHWLPAVHQSREFAVAGGLMSYGGSVSESHNQAGVYTGRILKGETPADLPVQQVTKVELFINLKTAKTFGVQVPPMMLALADEVFE